MILNIITSIQIFFVKFLPNALSHLSEIWFAELTTLSPLMLGILLQVVIIMFLIIGVRLFKNTKFSTLFEYIVEEVYKFFEEILERS